MATLVATAGAADANSFVTVAEASAYFSARLNVSAWEDSLYQEEALMDATRDISLLPWIGIRVTDTQALAWPRDNAVNPDATISDPATEYPYFADTEIPQRVKDATCEYALELLRAGSKDALQYDPAAVVKRKKVDVLETEYFRAPKPRGWAAYPRIVALLGPLLKGSGGIVRT